MRRGGSTAEDHDEQVSKPLTGFLYAVQGPAPRGRSRAHGQGEISIPSYDDDDRYIAITKKEQYFSVGDHL